MAATVVDVTKRKVRKDSLKAENEELRKRSEILEKESARALRELNVVKQELARVRAGMVEVNEASRLIVSKVAEQRKEFQESIAQNLDLIVHPLLDHLKTTNLSEAQLHLVDTLDFNLKHIASLFGVDLSDKKYRLSPREIQICRMIRNGRDSGAIAEACGLARQTVVVHRKNIRKKLGLKKNKQNLAVYLKEYM